MFALWIPYNGSWSSLGAASAVACIVIGMAYACALFYAPILWAAIRLKATRNMPPLPPGRIGIPYLGESLGYLRSWRNLLDLDVWYDTRYAKHGEIFTTHILGSPTVVMLGAQANKFVLINENKLFRNSWPKSIRVLIGDHAVVTSQGADHKRIRRILHSVLGIETLKKSVGRFERLVLHHLNSDWSPGHVIHAHDKLREMALCVAAESFMGLKAGEKELESFRRHFHDFNAGLLSHPLDLPWTTFGKAKRARAAIVAQIAQLIRRRKTCLSKSGEEEENFLDMVLRTQKTAGSDSCLSDEEIADNIMGLFTGGYDTTASALATILKHLSLHPHVLQRLRKDFIINKALQMDHPAASATDESFLPSFGKHKAFRSRKLLVEGEALTEKKVGRSSNDEGGAVKSPEASHVHASKIGSDDELTEKQASSIWTTRAIQVVNAEDQSNLEMNVKQGMRTSLKSFLSSLLKRLHKRAAVLKVSSKEIMSGRTLASKTVIPDSNSEKLSHPPETSQTFFNSHSTQSTDDDDDNGEITRMDYTPAQRKPPIHNESSP